MGKWKELHEKRKKKLQQAELESLGVSTPGIPHSHPSVQKGMKAARRVVHGEAWKQENAKKGWDAVKPVKKKKVIYRSKKYPMYPKGK